MLRRLKSHSRIICMGILSQQHEKKEDSAKYLYNNETEERSPLHTIKDSSKTGFKDIFMTQNSDAGKLDMYNHVKEIIQTEYTGWDRLRNFIRLGEHNEMNPSLQFTATCANTGFLIGFAYGGLKEYVKILNLFFLTNDTTRFMSKVHAQSELSRKGFTAFFKGGLLTAPKVGILVGTFVFTESGIAEYRGKNGFIEFPIAGGVTTAIMKCNLGIRGMISGFCTGLLAGLFLTPFIYLILRLQGLTKDKVKYVSHMLGKKREEYKKQAEKNTVNSYLDVMYDKKTKHLPPGFAPEE